MAEEKFDPTKIDPDNAPNPFKGFSFEPDPSTDVENVLKQKDPLKWLKQHPKAMRGDAKDAFKCAAEADKYKCTCWNKRCPFYGDCRKCIVFHSVLKQIPTCQRDLVIEMYKDGSLVEDLYIEEELAKEKLEQGE